VFEFVFVFVFVFVLGFFCRITTRARRGVINAHALFSENQLLSSASVQLSVVCIVEGNKTICSGVA